MRADYALTVGIVDPLRTVLHRKCGLPILMYHSVSPVDDQRSHPYLVTNVTPFRLREHSRWLVEAGYSSIGLDEAAEVLARGEMPKGRKVVITFDDGYADFAEHAWPILREHKLNATVFLTSGYIGDERLELLGRPCLTWKEIRALLHEGVRFGAHTVMHPRLVELDDDAMRNEVTVCRHQLEECLGEPITTFAYPYAYPEGDASFVERFTAVVRDVGYRCVVTTRVGTAWPGPSRFALPRLPMNSMDDSALFHAKLRGSYDWLGRIQRLKKKFLASTRG